jgi:hypothetical protein
LKGTRKQDVKSELVLPLNPFSKSALADTYNRTIGAFGRFEKELVSATGNPIKDASTLQFVWHHPEHDA